MLNGAVGSIYMLLRDVGMSEWEKIKELRDTGQITREEFKYKKSILFSNHK